MYWAGTLKCDNSGFQGYLGSLEDRPRKGALVVVGVLTDVSTEHKLTLAPSEPCSSKKCTAPLYMLLWEPT